MDLGFSWVTGLSAYQNGWRGYGDVSGDERESFVL